jgi:hypothetical protein
VRIARLLNSKDAADAFLQNIDRVYSRAVFDGRAFAPRQSEPART